MIFYIGQKIIPDKQSFNQSENLTTNITRLSVSIRKHHKRTENIYPILSYPGHDTISGRYCILGYIHSLLSWFSRHHIFFLLYSSVVILSPCITRVSLVSPSFFFCHLLSSSTVVLSSQLDWWITTRPHFHAQTLLLFLAAFSFLGVTSEHDGTFNRSCRVFFIKWPAYF